MFVGLGMDETIADMIASLIVAVFFTAVLGSIVLGIIKNKL